MSKYVVPVFLITRYEVLVEAESAEEAEEKARHTDTDTWLEDHDYCDTEWHGAVLFEEAR